VTVSQAVKTNCRKDQSLPTDFPFERGPILVIGANYYLTGARYSESYKPHDDSNLDGLVRFTQSVSEFKVYEEM
jgi:hypothetical protein